VEASQPPPDNPRRTTYFLFERFAGLFGRCVRAEAATLFTAAMDFGSFKSLEALDPMVLEVCSLRGLAILNLH
jgi:hypothetical protein